jgi:hypothetical protein
LGIAGCGDEDFSTHTFWRCIVGNQIVSTEVKFLSKELINAKSLVEFRLNGELVLSAELDKLTPEVQLHAALFGISQTVGDTCANLVKSRDVAKAKEAIADRWATLLDGSWTKSEKGPRRTMPLADLIRIASKLLGQDMTKDLTAMTVTEANTVAADPKVQEVLQAEKAAAAKKAAAEAPKSSLADLLAKLAAAK